MSKPRLGHALILEAPAFLSPGLGNDVAAWQLDSMSTITVPLPEEDLAFLRAYSEAQGTSAEAYLARQARNLRENLLRPLHADVTAASGIIPAQIAGREAHRGHLEKKHG
jgi:hypothetical protein